MPTAPLRPCAGQCGRLVVKGRCFDCSQVFERDRRPAWVTKFYSSKPWQNARNHKRRINPLCEDCLDLEPPRLIPVQVVDHIIPLMQAPELALTFENLRSLCHQHHQEKTHP